MEYPLKKWKTLKRGYKFGVPTYYNDFHLGTDIITKTGTPIHAPTKGYARSFWGKQGGLTIHLDTGLEIIRFLHLSGVAGLENVEEGDIIGFTGNTGMSTAPHLHCDISTKPLNTQDTSRFKDPEAYFKTMTWDEVQDEYRLIFHREADEDAKGYIGVTYDFFRKEIKKSLEWEKLDELYKVAKEL